MTWSGHKAAERKGTSGAESIHTATQTSAAIGSGIRLSLSMPMSSGSCCAMYNMKWKKWKWKN